VQEAFAEGFRHGLTHSIQDASNVGVETGPKGNHFGTGQTGIGPLRISPPSGSLLPFLAISFHFHAEGLFLL
jgi:hypothetical protein